MTIRRVGPAATPFRQPLGQLLITIDDLKALMDLIRPTLAAGEVLEVEFDGGFLSDPEELRQLSDVELKTLRIKTANIDIRLDEASAVAIGDETQAKDVYRLWARTRAIHSLDRRLAYWAGRSVYISGGCLVLSGAVLLPVTMSSGKNFFEGVFTPGPISVVYWAFGMVLLVGLLFFLFPIAFGLIGSFITTPNTVIKPMR